MSVCLLNFSSFRAERAHEFLKRRRAHPEVIHYSFFMKNLLLLTGRTSYLSHLYLLNTLQVRGDDLKCSTFDPDHENFTYENGQHLPYSPCTTSMRPPFACSVSLDHQHLLNYFNKTNNPGVTSVLHP